MTAADRAARSEHGDGPVERCPKCGDAGVVVDPQKHAEWHARGAPGLALGIDAGDGPVLGEEARVQRDLFEQDVRGVLMRLEDGWPEELDAIVERIAGSPHLAALLVQARADGAAEERNKRAAELREVVRRGCWVEQLWSLVHDWEDRP